MPADFQREDPEWNADRLWLPSAYAGIYMSEPDGACTLPCPAGWKERPKARADFYEGYVWVCEVGELRQRGESLSASYLEFFAGAFTALKAVL